VSENYSPRALYGIVFMFLHLIILVQHWLVTDGQTDRQIDGHMRTAYTTLGQRRAVIRMEVLLCVTEVDNGWTEMSKTNSMLKLNLADLSPGKSAYCHQLLQCRAQLVRTVTCLMPVSRKSPSNSTRPAKSGLKSWFASQQRDIVLYLATNTTVAETFNTFRSENM